MTDLFAGALRRLATSTSADLAYPLAQLPSLGAIALPLAIAQLVAVRIALLVFAGGMGYATSHLYSARAPLQPPVAATASPSPAASPRATAQTRGQTTARPQATLAPSVRTTTRVPLTTTRHS